MPTCKACGDSYTWKRKGGKWHAINADNSSHWANCGEKPRGPYTPPPPLEKPTFCASCTDTSALPWERCEECPLSVDFSSAIDPERPSAAERFNEEADARWVRLLELIGQP